MIDSGELRHRVQVQKCTTPRDNSGSFTETWTTVKTVYAKVEPLTGREFYNARQVVADVTHKITMRFTGLAPDDRLKHSGRVYDILRVLNIDKLNWALEVWVKELPAVPVRNADGDQVRNADGMPVYL